MNAWFLVKGKVVTFNDWGRVKKNPVAHIKTSIPTSFIATTMLNFPEINTVIC
jgi:hypothetical protein